MDDYEKSLMLTEAEEEGYQEGYSEGRRDLANELIRYLQDKVVDPENIVATVSKLSHSRGQAVQLMKDLHYDQEQTEQLLVKIDKGEEIDLQNQEQVRARNSNS